MASPRRYAVYSIIASLLTLTLKFGAWAATDSVGLFSDAVESLVNLSAALLALTAITVALRPADAGHTYGHGKAEFFSAGAEGLLIMAAAVGIAWAAVGRFLHPAPLSHLGPGILVAVLASLVNLVTALVMLRAARRHDSITLEADAKHLLTDVWTSVGLVAALAVILLLPKGWEWIDPAVAVAMALNIAYTGLGLVRRAGEGLMDAALPPEEIADIEAAIRRAAGPDTVFHALRTRKSGARRFIEFHLLVPGAMTVQASHDLCHDVEAELKALFPAPVVTIHVEPEEDHRSWDGPAPTPPAARTEG
ncbi:MAG: cation diffusion facilitator family transporter [Desulfovibrionaceae bacterium]